MILVMEDGQIVEQGTHHELLDARGHYFELYNSQFAAAIEELEELRPAVRSARDREVARGRSERTSQAILAVSISIASSTTAMTSAGRSSIMVQVNRSTHQPFRTRRFCRQRSLSNTSAPVWYRRPSISIASSSLRKTHRHSTSSQPGQRVGSRAIR